MGIPGWGLAWQVQGHEMRGGGEKLEMGRQR